MKTVFSYGVYGIWFNVVSDITVYDFGKVGCTYEDSETTYQVSDNVVKEIYGIINRFPELMQKYGVLDLWYPYIFDGVKNSFLFNNGEKSNTIVASNLIGFKDDDSIENKTADILILVLEEITELLVKNGIDRKYLSL
ncbi:MAG: hypothetical protein K2H28_05645 [Ruminococcus sp.]|nr:hypothetical protein [Ruminococcus sp.]